MKTVLLQIRTAVGLHARPAAMFVQGASRFQSKITVRNLTTQSKWVNAKSILGVLTMGVESGHEIELVGNGPDEDVAIECLSGLVRTNFGEV